MTGVPRIDAHVLAQETGPAGQPGHDDLASELALEGMVGIVLVQSRASDEATRAALALASDDPTVIGVVAWFDLSVPEPAARIEALRAGPGGHKLVGLTHPLSAGSDPGWLARDDVRRGLLATERAGLAFDLLIGVSALPAALDAAVSFPRLRFVLDHLAAPPIASGNLSAWGRALLPLAELPNVSAKLSGLVTEADPRTWSIDDLRHPVELAVDAFGPARLMVGSDWPRCLEAGSYTDVIDSVRYLLAELPTHEQEEILGGTAARVYRLAGLGA